MLTHDGRQICERVRQVKQTFLFIYFYLFYFFSLQREEVQVLSPVFMTADIRAGVFAAMSGSSFVAFWVFTAEIPATRDLWYKRGLFKESGSSSSSSRGACGCGCRGAGSVENQSSDDGPVSGYTSMSASGQKRFTHFLCEWGSAVGRTSWKCLFESSKCGFSECFSPPSIFTGTFFFSRGAKIKSIINAFLM